MGAVYLTVDDAPSDTLDEKVAILDEHDVPAVFFCEGRRVASHPERALAAIETGYHLGNHAYSHPHASDLSVERFRDEVAETEDRIEDVYDRASVARPARLFRFPYGDTGGDRHDSFERMLRKRDFRPPDTERFAGEWAVERRAGDCDWSWTLDVEDWSITSESDLEDRLESAASRLDSPSPEVVLFHDANNSTDLFGSFVDLLQKRNVSFGDPLELLAESA